MKINWKIRFKNPYFWIGLIGVILAAMGISPESLTSWSAVLQMLKNFISNPYMIGSVILAVIGVVIDPTTKGIKDSERAIKRIDYSDDA